MTILFYLLFRYELVGVTVHTGTADGGHYYSFIKERNKSAMQHDRWFLFNDAEVKPFDPSQIAAECFGGEMTVPFIHEHNFDIITFNLLSISQSKTYDSVTEKYLDFSFEKTNSAYMLFYERRLPEHLKEKHAHLLASPTTLATTKSPTAISVNVAVSEAQDDMETKKNNNDELNSKMEVDLQELNKTNPDICDNETRESHAVTVAVAVTEKETEIETETPSTSAGSSPKTPIAATIAKQQDNMWRPQLSKELEDWIWQDNRQFLQDRNIFQHTYFK